jgi:hypothetical protein
MSRSWPAASSSCRRTSEDSHREALTPKQRRVELHAWLIEHPTVRRDLAKLRADRREFRRELRELRRGLRP